MTLLFKSGSDRTQWWIDEFKTHAPALEVRLWPARGDRADIRYALVWEPPPGELATYPNLTLIFSLGAGVDHLFKDPDLPRDIPVARAVDASMTERVADYVLLHVLRHHRQQPTFERQQRDRNWRELPQPAPRDRQVGVMGMGALGAGSARVLTAVGFPVAGWSRTPKEIDGITSFHGPDGLIPFLACTDILVCLLPLTPATEDVLDARAFAALPAGAAFVNAGRGEQVVDADLLAALDSGHLSGATLDVFRDEPLPADHPYWTHPKVMVTPHIAGITDPRTVVSLVLENIRRVGAGEPVLYPVDRDLGY